MKANIHMTTTQYLTARIIKGYAGILATGTAKERAFSLKKLAEIADACIYEDLVREAKKLITIYG